MNPPAKVKEVGRKFEHALAHYQTLTRGYFQLAPDEELYAYVEGFYPMAVRVSKESAFDEIWERYSQGIYITIEFYAVKKSDED